MPGVDMNTMVDFQLVPPQPPRSIKYLTQGLPSLPLFDSI